MPDRFTQVEAMMIAARAMGKIDEKGRRGTFSLTHDEIEAMAVTLAMLGVPAISPTATEAEAIEAFQSTLQATQETTENDRSNPN